MNEELIKKSIKLLHKEATWARDNAIMDPADHRLMQKKIKEAEASYEKLFGEKLESDDIQ